MVYDFHTHSTLSDGELTPMELVRRAHVAGYTALAVSDHAGVGSLSRLGEELGRDCALASEHWEITALPGVELTHLPPVGIQSAAREARAAGLLVISVHGETVTEPVAEGTNQAAIASGNVDLLAHPGLITLADARLAAANDVFLELSAKPGHSMANGHVARMAKVAGARLLVNSDNHALDFLTAERIRQVILGSGLTEEDVYEISVTNPLALLARVGS